MIETGLQRCLREPPKAMRGAKLGLLMNQASIDRHYRYACDVIDETFPGQLRALYSPQHGLWCQQQANMDESRDGIYERLDLPVHSLYSETRRPSAVSLDEIECLVVDLQDVGTRVYTFIWTLLECLRACAEFGTRIVVLDRPNPIGGTLVEGPMLAKDHTSFVGGYPMPMRHGLTISEIALWLNAVGGDPAGTPLGAELTVVPMAGYKRAMSFESTGLPWVPPSPNMPTLATTLVYPGQVMLEGTNLSEGRGTTQPFELCGAPYLDAEPFVQRVRRHGHDGVVLQPIQFVPTFDKWKGQNCQGLAIRVTDESRFRSFRLTVSILEAVKQEAGDQFDWIEPPYEYEFRKPPIDILYGSTRLRERVDRETPLALSELDELSAIDERAWLDQTKAFRLYGE